jgi:predicted TIM-barrel fold metal-dependent hydrolase
MDTKESHVVNFTSRYDDLRIARTAMPNTAYSLCMLGAHMLSRRDVLMGAVAGAAALVRQTRDVVAAASQPATPVGFDVPAGACDCHTHIFGDPRSFPFAANRVYTPEPASIEEMRALHRALHVDRVVIVQPSVYGTDNACTLDAVRQLGSRARAVAVIDDTASAAALDAMHNAGVRGIRLNLATSGQTDPAAARRRLQTAVRQLEGRRWHIQIYTGLPIVDAIKDQVMASPIPVVFDHFGGAQAALGVQQAGFDALLGLVRSGKAYVKISGAYRSSNARPDYADVAPLAKALIAANPRRLLWGSDWPHPDSAAVAGRKTTDIALLLPIDDGRVLNQLAVWAPDAGLRTTILVDNPARLYGFA